MGWRVFWLVAAVAMPISLETAAAAPESVAASLMLKRSEMKVEPKPIASPSRTSSRSSARRLGLSGEGVERELVHPLHRGVRSFNDLARQQKFRGAEVERVPRVALRHRDEHLVAARRLLHDHRRDDGHQESGEGAAPVVVPAVGPRVAGDARRRAAGGGTRARCSPRTRAAPRAGGRRRGSRRRRRAAAPTVTLCQSTTVTVGGAACSSISRLSSR